MLHQNSDAGDCQQCEQVYQYSVVTKLLQAHHSIVLADWFEFLTIRPCEAVIYLPNDRTCVDEARRLCAEFGIRFIPSMLEPTDDLKNKETEILFRMVDLCTPDYVLFINLDTLPYRQPSIADDWLQDVVARMSADKSLKFFTACGFLFAGDARIGSSSYYRTQRFSNNCGLIEKHWWRECLIDPDLDPSKLSEDAFRYHSEWAIEEASKRQQVAGLRRMDSLGWRVFHVQQWDHRLLATRTKFRKGAGLNRYFNRVHEETLGAFNYYYNFPQPSFFRKFRIYAGKLRRSIFPRRSPQRN